MEHLESVEEAKLHVDKVLQEMDEEKKHQIAAQLDAQGLQDDEDCIDDENLDQHEDYQHCDPDFIEVKEDKTKKDKPLMRGIEISSNEELKEKTLRLDSYQREVLDVAVKYAKDVVKARKPGNPYPKAPLIMVHGGAGAGKSNTIDVAAQWQQKILQQAGDNPEQPYVMKCSFTGCAASNIEGMTIHGAFGFKFGNKYLSLSDKCRDKKHNDMKNVCTCIIDEISMVFADLFYMLDLRLQEIKDRPGVPFGGISIMVFGDIMQLSPCQGAYIFQKPKNADYMATHALKPRWKMFQCIVLEKNHRQGKDKTYADMLNRIRVGEQTEEDIELLQTRVRPKNHPDAIGADMFIGCKRTNVHAENLRYILAMEGNPIMLHAKHHHPMIKDFKPRIDPKDNAVGTTAFQNEIILKINARVMIIFNIDVSDMLTNGQMGRVVDVIRTKNGKVDKLILKLENPKAGTENRKKYSQLAAQYPDCVIIERISLTYTIRKKGGVAGSKATVIQFPIRLAYATTAHKIQGQSILYPKTVAMDIDSVFEPGQTYVMLSRIQCLDQLYITDKLEGSKITTSRIAMEEMQRLDRISTNRNPTPWNSAADGGDIRIASLNCAGLLVHLRDIKNDQKLSLADFISLQETSIEEYQEVPQLNGYKLDLCGRGRGKGVGTLKRIEITNKLESIREQNLQILKQEIDGLDIINVYRSSNKSLIETMDRLTQIINQDKPCIITGDFNICCRQNRHNHITRTLEKMGFIQLVQEATQIEGGAIDHVYWKNTSLNWSQPVIERYSPYYSDHDAILITLKKL